MWFDPNHRMEVCKSCSSLSKAFICKECGCFMPAKILIASRKCPLDKWAPVKTEKE